MDASIISQVEAQALSESLRSGATLPASWYTSESIFVREMRAIFSRYWQYACRMDEVASPGDYLACHAGNVPVVVVRNRNKEIAAFINVCRHRGAEIVRDGSRGNRNTLQCHYHAWTWGLDGSLRAAPGSADEPGFKNEDYPLTPVPVALLGPFLFVKPDPQAPSWDETIGELPRILQASPAPLTTLQFRERRTYDMKANWKIVVENFLECYHCAVAHNGFANLIDLNEYTIIPHRYFSTQRGPLKSSAKTNADAACFLKEDGGQEGVYNYLWPNFMINLYPGRGNASTNIILPVAPDRTLAIYDFYFEQGMPEAATIVAFIDQVQQEDIILCESVQRGLNSGCCNQGKLMIRYENGIQHFERLVFEALTQNERTGSLR
ncbi:MAG TPA: aromatic ring-hydroxylating dioxygenase subunit alpha [Gemmataceae bacterium]|nr:aromatic ring-hydroxylating dioxygenase subunit alpha [Gemmataceae bacterium]